MFCPSFLRFCISRLTYTLLYRAKLGQKQKLFCPPREVLLYTEIIRTERIYARCAVRNRHAILRDDVTC